MVEIGSAWVGVIVAVLFVFSLVVSQYLVQKIYRSWIRWRIGIDAASGQRGAMAERADDACGEDYGLS